jgi:hypothetical protein
VAAVAVPDRARQAEGPVAEDPVVVPAAGLAAVAAAPVVAAAGPVEVAAGPVAVAEAGWPPREGPAEALRSTSL